MEFVTEEDDSEQCSSTTLVYQVSPDAEDQQSLLTDQESTIDWTLQKIWSSQKPDQTDETSSSPEASLNDKSKPNSASKVEKQVLGTTINWAKHIPGM